MRNLWTVAKREFNMYFASPVAYAIAFVVLLVLGLFFYADFANAALFQGNPDATRTISLFVTLLLFFTPAITMRLMAEEQRTGTIELLLTAPVREWELVTGKWLAAFGFVTLLVAFTLIYALILSRFVTPGLDNGLLAAAYLGLILIVAAFLAVGVFVSTLFTNQIAAFFSIMAVILLLWVISYPVQNATGPAASFLQYLDFSNHFYNNFFRGVIDLADVVYFVSVTVFFLFLAARTVESRRWR
jgi:gliding motility-associated transport system permease protein